MITIMGATGHVGKAAAERLLDLGEKVRGIGRSADRLQPLVSRGAEAAVGDVTDAAFLTRAFTGADAVFVMFPPDFTVADYFGRYKQIGDSVEQAITASGVKRVVLMSSMGGEQPSGTGPIVGLHREEERLKRLPGLDLLIFRPPSFYENELGTLGLIKHQGINGSAAPGDLAIPMIAAADIGTIAADALHARDFTGVSVRDLAGPRDLSLGETTRIIGEAIGKPDLAYIQFPPQEYLNGLVQGAGFPKEIAELFLEMTGALVSGHAKPTQARTPANTGKTTFEEFTKRVIAPAYAHM
jgi:uncharacterized protein YbjT (DUF2867 family)